jgi:hypothetical protein
MKPQRRQRKSAVLLLATGKVYNKEIERKSMEDERRTIYYLIAVECIPVYIEYQFMICDLIH